MTKPRDPEALLAAYLVDGMTVMPERLVDAVLEEVHRTHQRPVLGPWRNRGIARATLAAAAVVAMLALVGALLVVGGGPSPMPSVSPEASVSASQPAVVTVTPTPTAEALSLDLTWTKVDLEVNNFQSGVGSVAWLGDRFVLRDDNGAISTSLDGATWTPLPPGDPDPGYADLAWRASVVTWEDTIVGWWNPEDRPGPDIAGAPPITARDIIRIVRSPAAPVDTSPFKGRIESLAIGPNGIVAQVHSDLDWDAWVTKKLGLRTNNDWTCCVKDVTFENGVLQIKLNNRPGLKVVWADEGFEPGDYQDAGFGWYSPDGEQWIPMPEFVTGFGEVVGVADGFIARGGTPDETCELPDGCGSMWHSTDGLTWRNLGHPEADPESSGRLVPWMGGALVTDGFGQFTLWSSDGYRELPMNADVVSQSEGTYVPFATGPLGLVTILRDSNESLLTRDGVEWKVQSMPAALATASVGDKGPTVAVGDRSVIYLAWAGYYGEGFVPSLWVGSVEP